MKLRRSHMTNLALTLAVAAAMLLGLPSLSFAGEGSPDLAVPSQSAYQGPRTVAPVAASNQRHDATVHTFDADEAAWLERASRAYNG
jgi:hypothetical protein